MKAADTNRQSPRPIPDGQGQGIDPVLAAETVSGRIEIHHEELLADWKLAINGEKVFRIDPLK
ncbi:MAG: hypothetical protein WCJ35_24730 [Planctomycetota bacterium]